VRCAYVIVGIVNILDEFVYAWVLARRVVCFLEVAEGKADIFIDESRVHLRTDNRGRVHNEKKSFICCIANLAVVRIVVNVLKAGVDICRSRWSWISIIICAIRLVWHGSYLKGPTSQLLQTAFS
jgi:hypothetical protein